jgi:hypothetical protein
MANLYFLDTECISGETDPWQPVYVTDKFPNPESLVDEALREGEYIEREEDAVKWLESRRIVVNNIYCIGETVGGKSYAVRYTYRGNAEN